MYVHILLQPMASQQSSSAPRTSKGTKRSASTMLASTVGKGKGVQKQRGPSKASVKGVHVNVSSSSAVTVNVSSGAANSQCNSKRPRKLPSKLLD
jgi:hypothetical protein